MAKFRMARSYESGRILDTEDLLTAVKTTCNYEGDLFVDNRLVMSCLGLSRHDNTRNLLDYGITSYVSKRTNCWAYRYTDLSKNGSSFFVNPYSYMDNGAPKIDFRIMEYRESVDDHMFESLSDVMAFVRATVAASSATFHRLEDDIHVRLFGEDGVIYFAPGDWQTEGEPQMYVLLQERKQKEYGAKHYMQMRYNQLQPKLGNYLLAPADEQTRDPFSEGEIIMLETAVDGMDLDRLYLIDKVEMVGDLPVFTIRDLDDFDNYANVQRSQITSPKVVVRQ